MLKQWYALVLAFALAMGMIAGCGGGTAPDDGGLVIPDTIQASDGNPVTRNQALGKGVNMGNMLEAPNEGEWGETVQQSYFTVIKNKGFDSVRIPIRWSNHASTSSPYAIDAPFFQRVDTVVNWALSAGLNVIIDMHHYNEIFQDPDGNRVRFLYMWQQISARYKDVDSASGYNKVYLEPLNEPNTNLDATRWNALLRDALAIIRQNDVHHTVIIGTAEWGGLGSLSSLVVPAQETNAIVTFHYYNPFTFTHQGADWVTPVMPTGVKWPDDYPTAYQDVRNDLDIAKNWGDAHGRPIFMGEFGAFSAGPYASRVNWTTYVRQQADARGMSWSYWEFCSGFGIYDNDASAWVTGTVGGSQVELVSALGL